MNRLPQTVGPYSTHRITQGLMFASGQIPLDPATNRLVEGNIVDQTQQVFRNIEALLDTEGLNFDHIVKTTVFLDDIEDFGTVNEEYAKYFTQPLPARSAVEVASIPLGARVEIEFIAEVDKEN